MRPINSDAAALVMNLRDEFPKQGWHQIDVLEYIAAELLGIDKKEVESWWFREGMYANATDK